MSAVLHGGEIQVRKTNEKLVAITPVITDLSLQPTRLNNAIDKRTATSCCGLTVRLFKGNQAFWVCDHENMSCARWSWNVIAAVRSFKFIFLFDFAKSERIWRAPEKMDRTFDLGWDPVAQKTFDKHGGTASALPEEANREYYECCGFVLKKATQVTFHVRFCVHIAPGAVNRLLSENAWFGQNVLKWRLIRWNRSILKRIKHRRYAASLAAFTYIRISQVRKSQFGGVLSRRCFLVCTTVVRDAQMKNDHWDAVFKLVLWLLKTLRSEICYILCELSGIHHGWHIGCFSQYLLVGNSIRRRRKAFGCTVSTEIACKTKKMRKIALSHKEL